MTSNELDTVKVVTGVLAVTAILVTIVAVATGGNVIAVLATAYVVLAVSLGFLVLGYRSQGRRR